MDGIEYVRAYPVADGRCPHCGGVSRLWTPARIIERLRAWREVFGANPSSSKLTMPPVGYPSTRVVADYFGSWDAALRAAGLPANTTSPGMIWTREAILAAIDKWARDHGDAPKASDWLSAGPDHPASTTVRVRFGTWNAAIDEAGFFPRGPWGVRLRGRKEGKDGGRELVDAEPVVTAVREYLGSETPVTALAELMNMEAAPLHKLLAGKRERIEQRAADAILTAIDRPDVLAHLEPAA